MYKMAKANLTSKNAGPHHNIPETPSVSIPEINITPQIWKKTYAGDVLVFAKHKTLRFALTSCIATGNF